MPVLLTLFTMISLFRKEVKMNNIFRMIILNVSNL